MNTIKRLKKFFNGTVVAIDIKKYNALKQEFDAFKIQTDKNFKKWFDKMPIGYAIHNKSATQHNKKVITNKTGVLAFAWAMYQPEHYLNKYLSNVLSHLAYEIADENILFDIYKQNISNFAIDTNSMLITGAKIKEYEYKFFYDIAMFEEFARKQYNAEFDGIDKILINSKGEEYKVSRNI